ncbi:MAG: autotransporter domain-containing protein [Betaproteobacteria bacterium]
MRTIKTALCAGALAVAALISNNEANAQFNQFYFFGDSLTDAGSYKPLLPPGTGLFTTNPGPVWAQALAQRYGSSASPANQGGNDYAQGGARVTQLPGVPNSPPTATAVPIATQIQTYLSSGPINPKALYSVWGGANDLFYQLGLAQAGAITSAQAQTNVAVAATQLAQQVGTLSAAGARYIMVLNLPDIGKAPGYASSSASSTISAFTSFYNSTMNSALDALHINIIKLNIFALFTEVIAAPGSFGLTNVTSQACTSSSVLICTAATLVAPNAAQTYAFADGVHPTTAGHQIIADYASSVISAPQQIGLLANAPAQADQANFRALDGRMWSALSTPRPQNRFDAYAVYDYGNYDRSGDFGGGSSNNNTIVIGGDMKVSDQVLAGISFGYSQDRSSLGGGGGYTLNDGMFTGYLGYGSGPWYVGATLGGGGLDYRNVHRSFALGGGNRSESGSTNGTQLVGRLLGGYWFNASQELIHGPYARLTYQKIKVDGYAESGTSSTAMSFGDQKNDFFSSSLGWQASGVLGSIRPFGRVSWEYVDSKNRDVTAQLVSLPGTFTLPAYKPGNNYALFLLGASMPIGRDITGFLSVNASAGSDGGNYQAVTVGIRAPL